VFISSANPSPSRPPATWHPPVEDRRDRYRDLLVLLFDDSPIASMAETSSSQHDGAEP